MNEGSKTKLCSLIEFPSNDFIDLRFRRFLIRSESERKINKSMEWWKINKRKMSRMLMMKTSQVENQISLLDIAIAIDVEIHVFHGASVTIKTLMSLN